MEANFKLNSDQYRTLKVLLIEDRLLALNYWNSVAPDKGGTGSRIDLVETEVRK